jgi:hypothetical protein
LGEKIQVKAPREIDTTPINAEIEDLMPIQIVLVDKTPLEALWDHPVKQYLGYRRMMGARLKYLVFGHGRPIAAISWCSAAMKVWVRDCFIGWSQEQKKQFLPQVANNNRFLILPWVRVPNLASYVLSQAVKILPGDWKRVYGTGLLLLETFV